MQAQHGLFCRYHIWRRAQPRACPCQELSTIVLLYGEHDRGSLCSRDEPGLVENIGSRVVRMGRWHLHIGVCDIIFTEVGSPRNTIKLCEPRDVWDFFLDLCTMSKSQAMCYLGVGHESMSSSLRGNVCLLATEYFNCLANDWTTPIRTLRGFTDIQSMNFNLP